MVKCAEKLLWKYKNAIKMEIGGNKLIEAISRYFCHAPSHAISFFTPLAMQILLSGGAGGKEVVELPFPLK